MLGHLTPRLQYTHVYIIYIRAIYRRLGKYHTFVDRVFEAVLVALVLLFPLLALRICNSWCSCCFCCACYSFDSNQVFSHLPRVVGLVSAHLDEVVSL